MAVIKSFLKEPLLHFVLLGSATFALYSLVSPQGSYERDNIIVTHGQIEHLEATFTKTWQRPPTSSELIALISDKVREEIFYREALVMGLDKDDVVIRRRLRQKMEFISEDVALRSEPTDEELIAYLETHPEKFRVEPRFTFQQIYLSPHKHGDNLAHHTAQLLTTLAQANDDDLPQLGDPLSLQLTLVDSPLGEVARQFGEAFAKNLAVLPRGGWQGPLESGYGLHLVRVRKFTQSELPKLSEVREIVQREWTNARREEANQSFYATLLERYNVSIESPVLSLENADLASAQ